jgi:hypothetical protein
LFAWGEGGRKTIFPQPTGRLTDPTYCIQTVQ